MKLTFMGAGSTVFSKNVIGDTMMCDEFHDMEVALYDINAERLEESYLLITKMNESINYSASEKQIEVDLSGTGFGGAFVDMLTGKAVEGAGKGLKLTIPGGSYKILGQF